MRLRRTAVALASALFLPACWVGLEQGRRMEADLARLKSDAADVRKARKTRGLPRPR
jgi:hypothetical protein